MPKRYFEVSLEKSGRKKYNFDCSEQFPRRWNWPGGRAQEGPLGDQNKVDECLFRRGKKEEKIEKKKNPFKYSRHLMHLTCALLHLPLQWYEVVGGFET